MSGPARKRLKAAHESISGIAAPLWKRNYLLGYFLLIGWIMAPLIMGVLVSLKQPSEVFSSSALLPRSPSLDAYTDVLGRPGFRRSFANSALVAAGCSIITLVISLPAAYAIARFGAWGRHLLLVLIVVSRLAPSVGMIVPLYRLAAWLGVLDSRLAVSTVLAGSVVPFAVWLLVGFLSQLPIEIEETALVDGASWFQRVWFVILPLSSPALFVVTFLCVREAWTEFDLVISLTTSPAARTLPYELYLLRGSLGYPNYPLESAFALLSLLPLLAVYLRAEKYAVQGILRGAVK